MPPPLLVFGSFGHAKVVIDAVELQGRYRVVGLVDPEREVGSHFFGHEVLGDDSDLPRLLLAHPGALGIVAIGDNSLRRRVTSKVLALAPGLSLAVVVHPSAVISRDAGLGAGTVVVAGAVVNTGVRIGRGAIVNTGALVDHDCQIGDYTSIGPGATLGGGVRVGEQSVVAIGATILHGRSIGSHAVVGAGALVTRDCPGYCVAYGTPARVIRSRTPDEPYM